MLMITALPRESSKKWKNRETYNIGGQNESRILIGKFNLFTLDIYVEKKKNTLSKLQRIDNFCKRQTRT